MMSRTRFFGFGALLLVLSLAFAGTTASVAQEGATPEAVSEHTSHPAHIHSGDCANVGEVVHPLADVAPRSAASSEATPTGATPVVDDVGMLDGMTEGIQAEVSVTIVEASLSDILSGDHLINVHLSADEIQTYIACGEITGTPDSENSIYIGLRELNDSGYSGVAWLRDNGDGSTYVTIFLAEGLHGADVVTEESPDGATPEAATPAA